MRRLAQALIAGVGMLPMAGGGQTPGAESDFQITAITRVSAEDVENEWTSAPGRWYRLDRATDLVAGDFTTVAPNLEANPPSNAHPDTLGGARCYFYRVAATGLPIPYPEPVIDIAGVSEAPVNATLHVDGEGSFSPIGRSTVRWRWRVEGPSVASDVAGASVAWASCPCPFTGETPVPPSRRGHGEVLQSSDGFIPSADVPSPMFVVDVPGTYTFYLDVWDEANLESWRSAAYQVTVIPYENEHTDEGTINDDTQITLGTPGKDRIVQYGYAGNDTQYASGLEDNDWIEQYGGEGNDKQNAQGGGLETQPKSSVFWRRFWSNRKRVLVSSGG